MEKKERSSVCDTRREAYKKWTSITLRYGDTDRQGHINNAVYCTLLESGRCDFLFEDGESLAGKGTSFVIAKLTIDYLAEMTYPGVAEVGSKIVAIGRSSFTAGQGIFLADRCYSTGESVIVLLDESTGKPTPITDSLREILESLT
jgi:acyl-CoA thioester hydrolase